MFTVAAVPLGAAAFHHLKYVALDHVGAVYIFDHANVAPLSIMYVPLLACA